MTTDDPVSDRFANPFSTRHVRPGAIAFQFPAAESAAALVDRLAQNGWRGEIVGPHGSGKSTLLVALMLAMKRRGRQIFPIALHDGERRLPLNPARLEMAPSQGLVIVDGYEQLGWLSRWYLRRVCRRHDWGLLVTAHQSVGFPRLFETVASLALARQIVAELAPQDERIGRGDVARSYQRTAGNLREMLFDLYDLYEARRGGAAGLPTKRMAAPEAD